MVEKQHPGGGYHNSPAPKNTTFVHADASSFREVVQRLTGPHEVEASSRPTANDKTATTPAASPQGVRRTPFKLHERRQQRSCSLQGSRPKLVITKPSSSSGAGLVRSASEPGIGSAGLRSPLPSPSSQRYSPYHVMSPTSSKPAAPIVNKAAPTLWELNEAEEEKAIRERRFYLHPSPRSRPAGEPEAKLLPLFPLTKPT